MKAETGQARFKSLELRATELQSDLGSVKAVFRDQGLVAWL